MTDRISFVLNDASDFDLVWGYYVQGVTSDGVLLETFRH